MPTKTEAWQTVRGKNNPLNRPMFTPPPKVVRDSAGGFIPAYQQTNEEDPAMEGLGQIFVEQVQNSEPGEIGEALEQASEMTGIKTGEIVDTIVHGITPKEYQATNLNLQAELGELARQLKAGEISSTHHDIEVAKITERMTNNYVNPNAPELPPIFQPAPLTEEQEAAITKQNILLSEGKIDEKTWLNRVASIKKTGGIEDELPMRKPSSKSESEEQPPKDEDTSSESEKPPKKEPPKEPTIFEKYGVEKDKYDEWDWLRDVGFSMMSNEGTGILDSFGIGATEASENLREASKSNRELKNKLKIKEAEAKAAAAKEEGKKLGRTITIYDKESGRDVVYRDVLMGTKDAIRHPYETGRWVVKEPKKPSEGSGKTGGLTSSAVPDWMGSSLNRLAERKQLGNVNMNEEEKASYSRYMEVMGNVEDYTREEVQKARSGLEMLQLDERTEGAWYEDLTDSERETILHQVRSKVVKALREDPNADAVTLFDQFGDEALDKINWKLEGTAKTDLRFSESDYKHMAKYLGDMVGKDVEGAIFNFDWLDVIDPRVRSLLESDIFNKDQFELLQADPVKEQSFLNDVAAKLREVADVKGVGTKQLSKEETEEVIFAGLSSISGGIDKFGPWNQSPTVRSFDDFIPEPRDITQQLVDAGYPVEWQKDASGRYGFRDTSTKRFLPYNQDLLIRIYGLSNPK